MLLLTAWAHAAPFFLAAGPEVEIDVDRSGNWPRAIPSDTGWDFFYASGGDFWHVPLDEALVPDRARMRALTGRSDLVDHAITRCPDGGFLHSASYTVSEPDDSVATFRYDGNLGLVDEATIVEAGGNIVTRDMPLVCGETFRGLGVFDMAHGTAFADVADTDEPRVVLSDAPMSTGSSWFEAEGSLWTVGHDLNHWGDIQLRGYDEGLDLHTSVDLPLVEAPLEAYWTQGLVRVGEYTVLAFMARDESRGWQLQDGDVWLAVFDGEWNRVETLPITTNTPPVGAMQPGLARKGDRLLVTYVRDLQLYAVEVTIDPGLVTAAADEAPAPEETMARGCAEGASGVGAGLLLPLILRPRRRALPGA